MKELRLYFEPKENVNVNHNAMFKHYADNYLADFLDAGLHYGGFISMNIMEKVGSKLEPVYQYIIQDYNADCDEDDIALYVQNNPMKGYYVHVYTKHGNNNLKHSVVYG